MAGLTIETKLRPCYVIEPDGWIKGLFHCWSFTSRVVGPSPFVGGHPGGVVAGTSAIVELENGNVILVRPENVKFVSGNFDEYIWDDKEKSDE